MQSTESMKKVKSQTKEPLKNKLDPIRKAESTGKSSLSIIVNGKMPISKRKL